MTDDIAQIWSHYGEDATGGGGSKIERLRVLVTALEAGRLYDSKAAILGLLEISQSYGYGEADSFLSDSWDRSTPEGEAHSIAYENALDEGDYAECIGKTETLLRGRYPDSQTLVTEAIDAMQQGYRHGRAMREANETADTTEPMVSVSDRLKSSTP